MNPTTITLNLIPAGSAMIIGLALIVCVLIWVSHLQFMAGYENPFFGWKTDAEKALREAARKKTIKEAERL